MTARILPMVRDNLETVRDSMHVGIIHNYEVWYTQHCAANSATAELLFVALYNGLTLVHYTRTR